MIILHVYIIILHVYMNILRVYIIEYLSSHVYIISYTNNTYVLSQMLQVSLQHCCWAPYQIAQQATIVNLVTLRGSWVVVLDNK